MGDDAIKRILEATALVRRAKELGALS